MKRRQSLASPIRNPRLSAGSAQCGGRRHPICQLLDQTRLRAPSCRHALNKTRQQTGGPGSAVTQVTAPFPSDTSTVPNFDTVSKAKTQPTLSLNVCPECLLFLEDPFPGRETLNPRGDHVARLHFGKAVLSPPCRAAGKRSVSPSRPQHGA